MKRRAKTLQSIIYRNYLSSTVISIFSIEVVLLLLYFGINLYISEKNRFTLYEEVTQNLVELTAREVKIINNQLKEVSHFAEIMQRDHQAFFNDETCLLPHGEANFGRHNNGAYHKLNNNGGGSLYYSSSTSMGPEELRKARCSEALDPLLISIVDTSPIITQAYLNTWDNMNRLYPFMQDAPTQYGPVLKMQAFNFYYDADAEHNPSRGHVWTDAYLDPAGQGWMISNLVPIYHGDFLEGISGLDVTISSFIENILGFHLPWESSTLMLDKHGDILAMQDSVENILKLQELTEHNYQHNITTTVKKPENYNISKHEDDSIRRQMRQLVDSNSSTASMTLNGIHYLVSQKIVPETGWRLITLIKESTIYQPIDALKMFTNHIGYAAMGIMFIFYIGFFFFLLHKSRRLTAKIAIPIEILSESTSQFVTSHDPTLLQNVGITEIDNLNHNYNSMMARLAAQTNALVESRLREQIKDKETELLANLAQTDQLTGLYNRYKLDQALQVENTRSQRYKHTYGLILMDLDYFKRVNDTYGHQVGDDVLVEMSNLLRLHTRETDTVGRWGGEEFLVICSEITPQGLLDMTENLRRLIEKHHFVGVGRQTASIGIAVYQPGDEPKDLIARADKALYLAKEKGRNLVELL